MAQLLSPKKLANMYIYELEKKIRDTFEKTEKM